MATYYWVGGSGTWNNTSKTNWSTSSGGTGGSGPPTSADTVNFNTSSGTTPTVTVASTAVAAVTTINKSDINLSLSGNATLSTGSNAVTLTAGKITLNTYTLTCGVFSSNNSNTRTLAFGTGNITVAASGGTVWDTNTVTGLTVTGTPVVNVTNSTSTATTVNTGTPSEANSISFNFTAGTYNLSFLSSAVSDQSARNVDFTGFSGTWLSIYNATGIFGDLKLSTGMTLTTSGFGFAFKATSGTKKLTSNGQTIPFSMFVSSGCTLQIQDAFTCTKSLSNSGVLDVSLATATCQTFSSTGSLIFGTSTIYVTGNNTDVVVIGDSGGASTYTGTINIVCTYTGSTGTRTFRGLGSISSGVYATFAVSGAQVNCGATATDIIALTGHWGNVDFTGFAQTLANNTVSLYGNLKISSGMTLTGGSNVMTFAATSGVKTLTFSGNTINFPLTINGAGGTFKLLDALTMGSALSLTHANGTLDLNGQTLTVGSSNGANYITAAGTKNLTFNGGTLVCPGGYNAFNNAAPTNFTTTAGTGVGKISMTNAAAKTFVGGGSTFDCTLSNDGAGALTIDGGNTFTTLANGVQPTTFTFTSDTTTTVTNWSISGTSGNLVTINSTYTENSTTGYLPHTLSKASGTVSANYLSISYSVATGGATWYAGANSTNGGNNTGWLFSSAPNTSFFLMFTAF